MATQIVVDSVKPIDDVFLATPSFPKTRAYSDSHRRAHARTQEQHVRLPYRKEHHGTELP